MEPEHKSNTSANKGSDQKLAQYYAEIRRKFYIKVVGFSLLALVSITLGMMFGGPRFNPILTIFGLRAFEYAERGVYADCSKPENKDISYCQPKSSQAERSWESIKKGRGNAFTLYEPGDQ